MNAVEQNCYFNVIGFCSKKESNILQWFYCFFFKLLLEIYSLAIFVATCLFCIFVFTCVFFSIHLLLFYLFTNLFISFFAFFFRYLSNGLVVQKYVLVFFFFWKLVNYFIFIFINCVINSNLITLIQFCHPVFSTV